MRHRKRPGLNAWLATAALAVIALTVLLLLSSAGLIGGAPVGVEVAVGLGLAALGVLALGIIASELGGHFDELERLRGDLLMADQDVDRLPRRWTDTNGRDDEVGRLGATMAEQLARRRADRSRPDARLEAVLGTVADGLVIASDSGLVVLINETARTLLGGTRMAVGTSLYTALERDDIATAVTRATAAGRPISAMVRTVDGDHLACRIAPLAGHGGIALSVHATVVEPRAGLVHDLGLLDRLPTAAPLTLETPLTALSASAIDTETTGLDMRIHRVLSVGVVRVHGTRVFHGATLDRLVNPAVEIPVRATAVHGLTNAMVAAAPPFRDIVPELLAILADTAVIGHNARFDLAMLAREMARAERSWEPPPALDTALLYLALEPGAETIGLGGAAARFGVTIQGRHTALGDSLVTAEIYVRMVPRLRDRGIETLGDALALQRKVLQRLGAKGDRP